MPPAAMRLPRSLSLPRNDEMVSGLYRALRKSALIEKKKRGSTSPFITYFPTLSLKNYGVTKILFEEKPGFVSFSTLADVP